MYLRLSYIKRFCLSMSVCAAFTSCIYDYEEEVPVDAENELLVSFSIAVENPAPLSRGIIDNGTSPSDQTWGDGYPAIVGSEFDSRIDLRTFRMAFYKAGSDGSLTLFASLQPDDLIWLSDVSSDGTRTEYSMIGYFHTHKALEDIRRGTYRAMIWVNTPTDVAVTDDPASLDGLAFGNMGVADKENVLKYCWDYSDRTDPVVDISLAKFDLIPMWGCATVSLNGIKPGEAFELKPADADNGDNSIVLLRSMAKTSVEPGEELLAKYGSQFEINSVTLVHSNRRGYVMPNGWQTLSDTRSLRFDATSREMSDTDMWNVTTSESAAAGRNGSIHTLYMPEYVNDDNRIRLSVDYTFKGVRKRNDIFFCKYSDGKPLAPGSLNGAEDESKYRNVIYDIVRNHHYRFVVGIDETTNEITVNSIRIEDWVYGGGGFLDVVD